MVKFHLTHNRNKEAFTLVSWNANDFHIQILKDSFLNVVLIKQLSINILATVSLSDKWLQKGSSQEVRRISDEGVRGETSRMREKGGRDD